ncbi:MAG: CPBP family intramembrane metalloprotease [Oscillospiraceae bacterium]|nr:CPBP family intramembrane metalloprotease [Oscillospiraceae bacterium]
MDQINIIPDDREKRQLRLYYAKISLIVIVLVVVFSGVNELVLYIASGIAGGGFSKELVTSGRKIVASIPLAKTAYSYFFPLAADAAALFTGLAITKCDLKKMLRFSGFDGKDLFEFTSLSYGMATAGSFICVIISGIVGIIIGKNGTEGLEESLAGMMPSDDPLWINILVYLYVCIIGPIMEELIFRGVLLEALRKYGNGFGIIMSAVMFGLMHQRFVQCIPAILLGIIFAGMAVKSGSLIPSIFAHIVNNTMSAVLMVMIQGMDMKKLMEFEKADPFNVDMDAMTALMKDMVPLIVVMLIILAVRLGALLVTVIISGRFFSSKRRLIAKSEYCDKRTWGYFFTSVPWIAVILYLTYTTVTTIV